MRKLVPEEFKFLAHGYSATQMLVTPQPELLTTLPQMRLVGVKELANNMTIT